MKMKTAENWFNLDFILGLIPSMVVGQEIDFLENGGDSLFSPAKRQKKSSSELKFRVLTISMHRK